MGVKVAGALPPSCAIVVKSGNLNFWNPLGHSRPVTGLLYLFYFNMKMKRKCE
jgi:hypothetical protein